jgi:hypothetical protein
LSRVVILAMLGEMAITDFVYHLTAHATLPMSMLIMIESTNHYDNNYRLQMIALFPSVQENVTQLTEGCANERNIHKNILQSSIVD